MFAITERLSSIYKEAGFLYIDDIFEEFDGPLWIRARKGAGDRLSLLCKNPEEVRL